MVKAWGSIGTSISSDDAGVSDGKRSKELAGCAKHGSCCWTGHLQLGGRPDVKARRGIFGLKRQTGTSLIKTQPIFRGGFWLLWFLVGRFMRLQKVTARPRCTPLMGKAFKSAPQFRGRADRLLSNFLRLFLGVRAMA